MGIWSIWCAASIWVASWPTLRFVLPQHSAAHFLDYAPLVRVASLFTQLENDVPPYPRCHHLGLSLDGGLAFPYTLPARLGAFPSGFRFLVHGSAPPIRSVIRSRSFSIRSRFSAASVAAAEIAAS